MSWSAFQRIVGTKWVPGKNVPFDPIATKKARALGLKLFIVKGTNLKNLENVLMEKDFKGTVVR